jgi:DNA-directed RNA polymerase specialized sigma24 family protein
MIERCVAEIDDDSCWLAGIQVRNRDSLERVFRTYSGQIAHFLSLVEPRQSPDAACLDVFEDLWHSAATNPPQGALADWLFSRAFRAMRDRASRAERRSPVPGMAPLEALTFEQRVIVALVYGVRLPLDSISKITAMPATEVTRHLSEARDRLRHAAAA